MFGYKALAVNEKGHLKIGGCDTLELVEKYGSPLYIIDENTIRNNCKVYKEAMEKYYDGNGLVLYASKALCTTSICKIIESEGLGLDVVSGGELFTAKKADFPMDKVYFHGNNKTLDEIEFGLECDIKRFIVDNKEELENINVLAKSKSKVAEVSFRIKPGIEAHTHESIMTGQIDSKFGVALENGEAMDIIKKASQMENIKVVGLHCHIGSQIFDLHPFEKTASVMIDFISEIKREFNIEISELNLGGGYGIRYTNSDDPIEYDLFIKSVSKIINNLCEDKRIKRPFILMEPGRSITGPAGITLYTVGSVKDIKDVRRYVAIDGGMNDNPRYALYDSEYDILVANNPEGKKDNLVTVAGKCCESGDLIAKDVNIQNCKKGDILAVLATGAYNYSMSCNYNRIPRPAIVIVKEGKSRLILKREDYEDLLRNDILIEF
jgi:diaminopimelate decarboxylase